MSRVIVTTCDNYSHVLKIFIHQFNKHWGKDQEVLVAGFSVPDFPLPPNFTFHSIGLPGDYPARKWSDALMKLLTTIDDEVFTLLLDDYIPVRPVNRVAIKILEDYMIQFKYVIKMDICEDRLYSQGVDLNYGHAAYIDLIKSMPGSPYHMSLWPGIWNRENLLKVLIGGETAQDLEIQGTTRLSHLQDLIVLGTRQSPLRIANVVRSDPNNVDLSKVERADLEDMLQQGLIHE